MAKTDNLGMPLPDEAQFVSEEFPLLKVALIMLDAAVGGLRQAMNETAAKGHGHELAEIEGLVQALNGKLSANAQFQLADLSDVEGIAEAPDGYVLIKLGGKVIAMSAVAALGEGKVLLPANNLSDVTDPAAARAALGLGKNTVQTVMPVADDGVDGDTWDLVDP